MVQDIKYFEIVIKPMVFLEKLKNSKLKGKILNIFMLRKYFMLVYYERGNSKLDRNYLIILFQTFQSFYHVITI